MPTKYQITLTKEEYDLLIDELRELSMYRYNDDHTHKDNCSSAARSLVEINTEIIDT